MYLITDFHFETLNHIRTPTGLMSFANFCSLISNPTSLVFNSFTLYSTLQLITINLPVF